MSFKTVNITALKAPKGATSFLEVGKVYEVSEAVAKAIISQKLATKTKEQGAED